MVERVRTELSSDSSRNTLFMLSSDSIPRSAVVPAIFQTVSSLPNKIDMIPNRALIEKRTIVEINSNFLMLYVVGVLMVSYIIA